MKQLSQTPDKCNFSFLWDFGAKIAFCERCNEIFCFCWLQIYWCCCICKAAVREFVLELVQKWYGFPCHFFCFFRHFVFDRQFRHESRHPHLRHFGNKRTTLCSFQFIYPFFSEALEENFLQAVKLEKLYMLYHC